MFFSRFFTRRAMASPARSFVKTIIWRVIAEIDTLTIAYIITGSIRWSLSIVGIESVTKLVLYYIHERVWGHITWRTNP